MWRHPVTVKQIKVLTDDWGVKEEAADVTGETRVITGWFKVITVSSTALLPPLVGEFKNADQLAPYFFPQTMSKYVFCRHFVP